MYNAVPTSVLLFLHVYCCSYMYTVIPSCILLFLPIYCCSYKCTAVPTSVLLFLYVYCCSLLCTAVSSCVLLFLRVFLHAHIMLFLVMKMYCRSTTDQYSGSVSGRIRFFGSSDPEPLSTKKLNISLY